MPDNVLADRTPDEALRAARDAVRAAAAEIAAATKAAAESTVAGIRAAAGAAGAQALFDESAYMQWITGEIETISQELEPILFAEFRKQLRTGADPKAIANANALAKRQSRRIAADVTAAEIKKVGVVIAEGIQGGQSPIAVARRLTDVKGLTRQGAATFEKRADQIRGLGLSNAETDRRIGVLQRSLLRERRERIATTEMRMATSEAKMTKARDEDKQFKASSSAGDGKVDDECAANEAQGWIPIDQPFSSGHDTSPYHTGCRCNVVTKTQPPTMADDARREAKAAQTADAIAEAVAA